MSESFELIDTHCHLDFNVFDDDRDTVINNAYEVGVTHMINPGVDIQSSEKIIELSRQYEAIFAAVGVHPNSSNTDSEWLIQLKKLVKHAKVVAIGEIGLDYYRKTNSIDYQKQLFNLQLRLAQNVNLPVIIHSRQAGSDVIQILSGWKTILKNDNSPLQDLPGVLHSFSDELDIAKKAIELGFFIGITGPITFSNAQELQATIANVPVESLLIETDAPFLTPHPNRGKRNEPANIIYIAEKIAEIHNLPLERVIKQTTLNAKRVFRLRD